MSLTFTKYATPPGFAAFSTSEFSSMSFERAADLAYPKIAPPNSIVSWCYSTNIPTSAVGTVITPRDTILHSTDLLPILHDMEVMKLGP